MRTTLLVPLALSTAIAVGACRTASDGAEQTAFQVPKRDLTLSQVGGPQVEVASPVELARVAPTRHQSAPRQQTQRRPTRTRHHTAPAAQDAKIAARFYITSCHRKGAWRCADFRFGC